ncbi:MAG: sodium-dependent transporter [Planctomycetota bacterium]|nr:sodium-dependent transporter [Planctomycetota bacterium]
MAKAKYLLEEQRENWGSRAGFVLAAIGSAVGLGNLWGFPYKVYDNGGGAFLIPYLLAMLLIGIPLLILEFSLGHMTQRAAPDAYRGINRKAEPIGWWGILLGFIIITYYPVILAWCGSYLVECLKGIFSGGELPWAGKGLEGVRKASDFFYTSYLQKWTDRQTAGGIEPWAFGKLVTPIIISLAVIWILMYLCIFRGVRLVSKVVMWTVPLPWVMLLILTVRGLTLPGAAEGLNFFLKPDWSELAKPETWRWGFGQMFFSMSLAFGVMITYASFLHRKSDINNNATIIGLADIGTSFVAGIAVFATLGAMAYATSQAGQPVGVENVVDGGAGLAFVAFPYALAQLPGSAWFGAIFFIALLTLGIDSAFSITESVLASLVDKTGWNRNKTLIGISVIGICMGLVYCTRGGLNWLGGIDDFINSPWGGIALVGLLEAVVVGWAYRISRLRQHANERSDWKIGVWWDWIIRYIAPVLLSVLFVWSLLDKVSGTSNFLKDDNGRWILPTLVGLIVAVAAPGLAVILGLIRSPGADTHAQHVGQKCIGRASGLLAAVLALVAIVGIAWGFDLARHAKVADVTGRDVASAMVFWRPLGYETPRVLVVLAIAALAGLSATVIASSTISQAEKTDRRPSGFARLSAGLGVMSVGGATGVLLAMLVLLHKSPEAATAVTASSLAADEAHHLSPLSLAVLAGMLGLLVVGLGWCFYRALKASGAATPSAPQTAERMDD